MRESPSRTRLSSSQRICAMMKLKCAQALGVMSPLQKSLDRSTASSSSAAVDWERGVCGNPNGISRSLFRAWRLTPTLNVASNSAILGALSVTAATLLAFTIVTVFAISIAASTGSRSAFDRRLMLASQ